MPNIYYMLGHGYRILSEVDKPNYQRHQSIQLAEEKPYFYFSKALSELTKQRKINESTESMIEDVMRYIDPADIPANDPPTEEDKGLWWLGYYHSHDKFLRSMEFEAEAAQPLGQSSIAAWIIAAREERGMTQAELAAALNVPQPTISRWETGASTPRSSNIQRLKQIFESRPV